MVEINRANQVPVHSQTGRTEQQALAQKVRAHSLELANPAKQDEITFNRASGISEEISKRLDEEASRRTLSYVTEMKRTQSALQTSVEEFAAFKEAQLAENPGLDLSNLDLSLQKDGSLKLTASNLSASQLASLEQKLADNDKLKNAFTQVHSGIISGLKHRDSGSNADLQKNDLHGALRLNELTERFSEQFHPDGFGQDYTTLSQQLNSETGLFGHFLLESVNPKISVMV
ncbi:hypothetical protein [Pseudoalteromonas viridis]|uniref:Uncharacterized protein n=1 Tax=Pseudoalteromonas viridis TaxID=339617 RepID=A0ABX7V4P5_9GAMM|nr:hypothetical protein [Pseudoalteromonas viridis]QTL34387.1 hypothetical protein J5X90_12560 [Pseudoalteromonas viridis]